MAYVSVNNKGVITAVADRQFSGSGPVVHINTLFEPRQLLGKRLVRRSSGLKVGVVCNWGQQCGISTYTKYLVDALRPKVKALRVFSEVGVEASPEVVPCWVRGQSMVECLRNLREWDPDFVIVQHEFGIFPRAPYLLQMLQALDTTPYVVVLHSAYEHLDKSVCTSAMRDVIVHTGAARDLLRRLGNSSRVHVVPHGCVTFPERVPLWNIYQTDHVMVQFGFGFFYKGVDRAIDAVHILKTRFPGKYASGTNDIFYCYYCSENDHTRNVHSEYLKFLSQKIESLGLQDNVVVIRKYNTEQEINNILRTAKLAIFPYLINPGNVVYGASGALRVAFANGIPCVASESHLFDEIPGLPRPADAESLAAEIHKVFSNCGYKNEIVRRQDDYAAANTWESAADQYLKVASRIRQESAVVIE